MKKQLTALTLAAALCGISSPAFANLDQPTEKTQPVKMTEQQLDDVTAGALVNVVTRLRNVRNTIVDIDVDTTVLTFASSKGKKHDMKKHHGKRRH
jgi:hypothetical protein